MDFHAGLTCWLKAHFPQGLFWLLLLWFLNLSFCVWTAKTENNFLLMVRYGDVLEGRSVGPLSPRSSKLIITLPDSFVQSPVICHRLRSLTWINAVCWLFFFFIPEIHFQNEFKRITLEYWGISFLCVGDLALCSPVRDGFQLSGNRPQPAGVGWCPEEGFAGGQELCSHLLFWSTSRNADEKHFHYSSLLFSLTSA